MKQNLFLDIAIDKIDKKYIIEESKTNNFKTTHYIVAKENKKALKREIGDYFVINFSTDKLFLKPKILTKELIRVIKSFLKKYNRASKVLIVGLGNRDITADFLGVSTTNKIIATNQYHDFLTIPNIAIFNPSVNSKTGINSYKLIEMVVNDLNPDLIILIDSLFTKNEEYLNSAIEVNNTGIIPGSILNSSREINEKTFNKPILVIGAPTTLELNKKLYTSVDVSEVIASLSSIISDALNTIFLEHH
jgi:spore protease